MAATVQEITGRLSEVICGSKVFGEPIERDGATVVPVVRVSGGGGGADRDENSQGFGGGIRVTSRPVGVYVLRGGEVFWKPSVDVNQTVLAGAAVILAGLATVRALIKGAARR